jgi:hypothetical protein
MPGGAGHDKMIVIILPEQRHRSGCYPWRGCKSVHGSGVPNVSSCIYFASNAML